MVTLPSPSTVAAPALSLLPLPCVVISLLYLQSPSAAIFLLCRHAPATIVVALGCAAISLYHHRTNAIPSSSARRCHLPPPPLLRPMPVEPQCCHLPPLSSSPPSVRGAPAVRPRSPALEHPPTHIPPAATNVASQPCFLTIARQRLYRHLPPQAASAKAGAACVSSQQRIQQQQLTLFPSVVDHRSREEDGEVLLLGAPTLNPHPLPLVTEQEKALVAALALLSDHSKRSPSAAASSLYASTTATQPHRRRYLPLQACPATSSATCGPSLSASASATQSCRRRYLPL
ncbi:hypothetical protein BHM03_00022601 [Ensete ventricosum]|nr:hypothetical protein BHM03_00022601 [Ensete ventricosum]